jgi:hypothetical protein
MLGSILGNKKPAPPAKTPDASTTDPAPQPEPSSEPESEPDPEPKTETTEDKVENALRGLFGGKKDD